MDAFPVPFAIIVIIIIIAEIVIVRIVRKRSRKKREQMTATQLGVSYHNLLTALKVESDLGHRYSTYHRQTLKTERGLFSDVLGAVSMGHLIMRDKIAAYLKKLDASETEPSKGETRVDGSEENFSTYNECERQQKLTPDFLSEDFSQELACTMNIDRYFDFRFQARKDKQKEACRIFSSLLGSAKANRALMLSLLDAPGQNEQKEISVCTGCGSVELGRHSAFCPVCSTPGFEFKPFSEEYLAGLLDKCPNV
jgi:rubrerythrin